MYKRRKRNKNEKKDVRLKSVSRLKDNGGEDYLYESKDSGK